MNRLSAAAAVFGIFLAPVCSDSAWADRRVALVIGNSDYQNAPALLNPTRDAQAIAAMLRKGGFAIVTAHYDLGNLPFKRAVRQFEDLAADADIAVVFYAGHGIEIRGANYMIPVDAKLANDRDADDEAITLDRLVGSVEEAKQLGLVILDACRDNPFVRRMKRPRTAALRAVTPGLGIVEPPSRNTLIAYAAKAGLAAEDGDREHSPFTAAILKHLFEPGLDIRMAFGRVRDEVLRSTGNKQEPLVSGSLGAAHIALVPAPPQTALAAPDVSVQRSDYSLVEKINTRGAWEAFLAQHPIGFYADLARAQLAKLTTAEEEKAAAERARVERAQAELAGKERAAREQAERERLEKERLAKEQAERERLERERVAGERAERLQREQQARVEAERRRAAREQAERERVEKERIAKEQTERERLERERVAAERAERAQREQQASIEAERQRAAREGAERMQREQAAKLEAERQAREEAERAEAERASAAATTQTALLTPATEPAAAAPAPAPSGGALIQEIKKELQRVGCYFGGLDDKWPTAEARESVQKFARFARATVPTSDPSSELLDAIRGKSGRVCPLECGARQVEKNGRCVAKTCPAGLVLGDDGDCERKTERRKTAARSAEPRAPESRRERSARPAATRTSAYDPYDRSRRVTPGGKLTCGPRGCQTVPKGCVAIRGGGGRGMGGKVVC